jgi:hypothetical protein
MPSEPCSNATVLGVKAEVRFFHSPNIDSLSLYVPPDPDNFAFLLQVMVGPSDRPGEELFDVEVCSPQWLSDRLQQEQLMIGRHHVFVAGHDWDRISALITRWVARCEGNSWSEVVQEVGRLGHLEFKDYRPFGP